MSVRRLIIILWWLSCLVPSEAPGQTLSPGKALGRYQQLVWQDRHGLPQNGVNAITRTRDGYLWLGTFEGAARFDGVRFTVFDTSNTPEFKSNQIMALVEDRAGHLWIGTNGGGLIRRTNESFRLYTTSDGLASNFVRNLAEDREGNLWLGTEGGGLNRFRDGRFDTYTMRDGLPDDYVRAVVADPKGGLWVGTRGGLALFKDGRFTVYTVKDGLPMNNVRALCLDHADTLWVGTYDGGLSRFAGGRFVDSGLGLAQARVTALYEDSGFGLWIGTEGDGLALFKDGKLSSYTLADGLPGDTVRSLYQDAEGDVWIGTLDGGVCQLRAGRFGVYTKQDGLPHNFALALYEDAGGHLWVGTSGGLARFKGGSITSFTTRDGLPENVITAITEDRAGNLWVGAGGKLYRFHNNRFTLQPMGNGQTANQGISMLLGDRAGNLWIGTRGRGLNLYRDGRFTLYTTQDGLVDNDIISLYEDRQGSLWVGAQTGGISRLKDGRFDMWTTADGLTGSSVNSFYEDRQGSLWIGTEGGGLSRFRDGKYSTITVKDGLYDNLAFQILSDTEDDSGSLWMSCNKGIYRVRWQELNDFAEGRIKAVNSYAYGVIDGMLSRECNGAWPAGWKTRDGRLWFPTIKGVVVIDPQPRDTRQPLVAIERVTVDRAPLPVTPSLPLKPEQESLEIEYTALSWRRPQQVRFRYQLAGLDQQWIEAGGRRTAYYSHLPPGAYTFKVIADNGEGVWNTEGQSLNIVVLPPFYQTWWFTAFAAVVVSAAVFLIFRYRVAQLHQRHAQQQAFSRQLLESQEQERKRIAAELHDSLGQQLLVIKNWALIGLGAMSADHRARETLDEISTTASQAVNEVREIIYALRPYQLDKIGLANTLKFMIEKVAAASNISFETKFADVDGLFTHESEITLYRIVQECVNNIIKHSQATTARVFIERNGRTVNLTIEDNGRGFPPAAGSRWKAVDGAESATSPTNPPSAGPNPQAKGFGLTGIAERVRMLGGKQTIITAPGDGTKIHISIETKETNENGDSSRHRG